MESPDEESKSAPASPERESVPLISEINELIEKERLLLELRLIDKNLEAERWKAKYEQLKSRVLGDDVDLEDPAKVQAVIEVDAFDPNVVQTANMRQVLVERISQNYVDLSGLQFSKPILSNLSKLLFGSRSSYPSLRIARLRDCQLTAEHAEGLAHLLRSPQTDALDLTGNFLDLDCMRLFAEVLRNRRETPQYLLLARNPALGAGASSPQD
eukprot:gene44223-54073_t